MGLPLNAPPAAGWAAPEPVHMGAVGPGELEEMEMVEPPPAVVGGTVQSGEEDFSMMLEDASARVDLSKLPPIPLFSDLSKNAFIELMERMDIRNMNAGDVVVKEGEVGNSFFIIASGQVHVETLVNGQNVTLA